MTTVTGPTARSVLRTSRGPVAVVAVLLLVAVLLALYGGTRRSGSLDPRAYDPSGTHALSAVLESRGTTVQVVDSIEAAVREASSDTTVVVPFPQALTAAEVAGLRAGLDGKLVVVGADPQSTDALGLDLGVDALGGTSKRAPGCSLPAAEAAGSARLGGYAYVPDNGAGTRCYDGAVYVRGTTILVGSGEFLTNGRLDQDGNAALALGLLRPATKLLWLLPGPSRLVAGEQRSFRELLPEWVLEAVVQLGIAVVLLALWRARRLGRVVPEPLPVVVRAAEAVEGRGRLYRAAKARDRAAEALRWASRDNAARRLGLGLADTPASLVDAAAARTGRPSAAVESLLYGPVPGDDDALVRLADALSTFDSEVCAP